MTVLLVGGTGRTGGRVLEQLLGRGAHVRAIVRDARRLPAGVSECPGLTVVEADLLSMSDDEIARQVRGCDAVISCLGHVISLRGVFGPPWDLVALATRRLCRAIEGPAPVRFILMSSVSVNRPDHLDTRRGNLERAVLWLIRALAPPARDNQAAADFLCGEIGTHNPFVQWVAVRPDTLVGGDVSEYEVHESLVNGLFAPGRSSMANVAHFMCELATDAKTWEAWMGKLPVITNASVGEVSRARE